MISAIIAVAASWHWPLFGDAGIFHYIVFAIQHGAKPYTALQDFNFPGTYFLDALTMQFFGRGAVGERVYDLCLCGIAALGLFLCLSRSAWARTGATLASGLLILIHLYDGLGQEGQRDFAMAASALMACGIFLYGRTSDEALLAANASPRLFLYQLIVGAIFTIKPTLLLLAFAPFAAYLNADKRKDLTRLLLVSAAGFLLAPLLAVLWLVREHSLGGFVDMVTTLGAVHGALARRSVWHLLSQGVSPVGVLVLLWLVLLLVDRPQWSAERRFLGAAAVCGFVSYWIQGKGLVYQRYPFLALVLLLVFFDVGRERKPSQVQYAVTVAYIVVGLWFCPKMLHKIRTYENASPFESALATDLRKEPLAGGVQCLDTYSGCLDTLYNMGAVEPTGELYDCYLYTAASATRDRYRQQFLQALRRSHPAVLVMSDQDCFHIKAGFGRVQRWPELATLLNDNYKLETTWSSDKPYLLWSRGEVQPAFEIFLRR
jgi:hypothetical protein